MDVLVFKTNVINARHATQVKGILNTVQSIRKWNFDLDDCDNILRIVDSDISAQEVEDLLGAAGIFCKELAD
ncbi:MAG TPA: hypothetical protein VNI52_11915 [Sphingobacteriaceae bacterium]|nr:hypothetical protein [Sphingobacteriaceae bacterium]